MSAILSSNFEKSFPVKSATRRVIESVKSVGREEILLSSASSSVRAGVVESGGRLAMLLKAMLRVRSSGRESSVSGGQSALRRFTETSRVRRRDRLRDEGPKRAPEMWFLEAVSSISVVLARESIGRVVRTLLDRLRMRRLTKALISSGSVESLLPCSSRISRLVSCWMEEPRSPLKALSASRSSRRLEICVIVSNEAFSRRLRDYVVLALCD